MRCDLIGVILLKKKSKKKTKKTTFMRHHMCDGIVTEYKRVTTTTGQNYNIVPQ
jgi:hypothetical protein